MSTTSIARKIGHLSLVEKAKDSSIWMAQIQLEEGDEIGRLTRVEGRKFAFTLKSRTRSSIVLSLRFKNLRSDAISHKESKNARVGSKHVSVFSGCLGGRRE